MAKCQVPECFNRRDKDKGKKSFFRIPDPAKGYRELAQSWLTNIGSGRRVEGFVFSKNKLVCEDHFEGTCFREDLQARALGYRPARKKLKPGSVPTVFRSCQDGGRDPRLLWPSQHLTLSRKNSRILSRPKPDVPVPVLGDELRSISSSSHTHGDSEMQGEEPPPPPPPQQPLPKAPTVEGRSGEHDDVTREPGTGQILTPVVSPPDTLNLAPRNHLKGPVRLVEFADKEAQTDPVLILPIRRYDCWHGNRVSLLKGQER